MSRWLQPEFEHSSSLSTTHAPTPSNFWNPFEPTPILPLVAKLELQEPPTSKGTFDLQMAKLSAPPDRLLSDAMLNRHELSPRQSTIATKTETSSNLEFAHNLMMLEEAMKLPDGSRHGTLRRSPALRRSQSTSESAATAPSVESKRTIWEDVNISPRHVEYGCTENPESGKRRRFMTTSRSSTQRTPVNGGMAIRTKMSYCLTTWIPKSENGVEDFLRYGQINIPSLPILRADPFLFDPSSSSLPASTPSKSASETRKRDWLSTEDSEL